MEPQMDTDEREILLKEETHTVVGCAFEVQNELGHGLREKTYERALVVEFGRRDIPCDQQREFEVFYKGVKIDTFIPDLMCFEKIVVDTKVIDRITSNEIGQMLNYLKITGLRVGLILNFKKAKVEWQRIVR